MSTFRISRLSFGTRLGLGFAAVLLLMIAMALFSAIRISRVIDIDREIEEKTRRYVLAEQWRGNTQLNLTRALAIAKSGNNEELAAYFKPQIAETTAKIADVQKTLESVMIDDASRDQLAVIAAKRKQYMDIRASILAQMQGGDKAGAQVRVDAEMIPAATAYQDSLSLVESRLLDALQAATPALREDAESTLHLTLAITVFAVGVGGLLSWIITRSITVPMRRAIDVAQRVSDGDLSQALQVQQRDDEIGRLESALAGMQERLRGIVSRIRVASEGVSTASSEIAAGGLDLSKRTEEAASSLEQTAGSIAELSEGARRTAATAQGASELASAASDVAARGGEAVAQVVSTMSEITESSRRIADIIGVIDGIAFQTNILALNAAVESARAGEQGRGFAVVAGEVRSLAQRSATAAQEIKALISDSTGRVESGSRHVEQAGRTMGEIVSNVQRVAAMIGEISAAAQHQQEGIDLVRTAVTQLDAMTQQNSALVEQSTAATESLREQTVTLSEAVQIFRVQPGAVAA
jgi:methyl-accepting chemotaxis protein